MEKILRSHWCVASNERTSCEDGRGGRRAERRKGVLANALGVSFLAVAVVAVAQSPTVSIWLLCQFVIQDCAGYSLLTYSHLHQSGQKRGIGDQERKRDRVYIRVRVRWGERGLDSFRNSIMRGEATAFTRVGGKCIILLSTSGWTKGTADASSLTAANWAGER